MQHPTSHGAIALAVSRLHRARSIEELHRAHLAMARELMEADAVGFYLLDERLQPTALYSHGAPPGFLTEYEKMRAADPMFRHLVATNSFTHSMALLDGRSWLDHPLHRLMTRWGLDFTIEAPLTYNGIIRGTINMARGGRKYFSAASLDTARFLTGEINIAFQRICEVDALRAELDALRSPPALPPLRTRARQVAEAAAAGLGNREIASRLGISENTVRTHLKQIYRALGVRTRAQLARRFYSNFH